jgi:AraC-like DNA-binding protein
MRQFIRLFLAFQAIWLVYLVPYVIPSLSNKLMDAVDWYPVYIPLVILIYCLGIKGYLVAQQEIPAARKAAPVPPPLEMVEETLPLLTRAMESDRLYLDPDLNLASLSLHTGLPQKTISLVLNQHLRKSFNEFVNGYRVEAFKQKLQEPAQDNMTILGMALDAGFNSQATFQRAFRNSTGMSPREYMNRNLRETPNPGNE